MIICGVVNALADNEISTSSGDLVLSSATDNINAAANNFNISGNIYASNLQSSIINATTQLNTPTIVSGATINIQPSGDTDDYLQFKTDTNIPILGTIGGNIMRLAPGDNAAGSSILEVISPPNTGGASDVQLWLLANGSDSNRLILGSNYGSSLFGMYFSANNVRDRAFFPDLDSAYDLGTSTYAWANVYTDNIANPGAIKVLASGDTNDYSSFSTVGDVPQLNVVGGGSLVYKTDMSSVAKISFDTHYYDFTGLTIYNTAGGFFTIGLYNDSYSGISGWNGTGMLRSNDKIIIIANDDLNDFIYFDTVGNVARMSPFDNNTYTLGYAGKLWAAVYAKSTVTSDMWYAGGSEYMIRQVEKPEGLVKQFIPKIAFANCKDDVRTKEYSNGTTYEDTVERYDECLIRVAEHEWDTTKKITETYEGDIINENGDSFTTMKDQIQTLELENMALYDENIALKKALIDKGVITQKDLDDAKTVEQIKP